MKKGVGVFGGKRTLDKLYLGLKASREGGCAENEGKGGEKKDISLKKKKRDIFLRHTPTAPAPHAKGGKEARRQRS